MASNLFDEFPKTTKELWKKQAIKDLKGKDFEQTLVWQAEDQLAIEPYFVQDDLAHVPLAALQQAQDTASARQWQNLETILLQDEASANAQALEALERGADALVFDLQHRLVNEVDYKKLLHKIKLSESPVFFKIQENPLHLFQTLQTLIPYQMKGGMLLDVLGQWMQTGTIAPNIWDELAQVLNETAGHPQWKVLQVSSEVFHQAGGSAAQEIAFTLANALVYIDELTERQIELSTILAKLHISLSVGTDYFTEIAKIRAFRYVWQQLLIQGYGVANPPLPHIQANTSFYYDAALTPNTNMLRATTEAMAGIIGGCDALQVHAYNAAFETPDHFGQRMARNISSILKEESYLDKVNDPSAGSYFIENLTFALAEKALVLLQSIEAQGGIMKAFEQGTIQAIIADNHAQRVNKLTTGSKIMVGVNKFRFDEKPFMATPTSMGNATLLSNNRLATVIENAS